MQAMLMFSVICLVLLCYIRMRYLPVTIHFQHIRRIHFMYTFASITNFKTTVCYNDSLKKQQKCFTGRKVLIIRETFIRCL